MGLMGILKLILPLILEYAKELLFPGTEAKKTTPLERISVILVIILLALLTFVGDKFFVVHEEKSKLEVELNKSKTVVEMYQEKISGRDATIVELKQQIEEYKLKPQPNPLPYDEVPTTPEKVVRDEEINIGERLLMIEQINGDI